ncbi:MAG: glutamate-cysteine ligase family protein [Patescibacteria group bacterium]
MTKINAVPLKHLTFGIEFEFHILDKDGYIHNGADRLLKRLRADSPSVDATYEASENLIELRTKPHTNLPNIMWQSMEDFKALLAAAEKEELVIYHLGTYPGTFTPAIRNAPRYRAQEEIFGKQRFAIAGRCAGMHCHFTLPRGVYSKTAKNLVYRFFSNQQTNLVNVHNLFIAMDPALIAFSQSSPFYQGTRLGKASRIIAYRGGKPFNYPGGLYANYQDLGALQPYEATGGNLLHVIQQRSHNWKATLHKLGIQARSLAKRGSLLDASWNPIRINSVGTIEHRAPDMNDPEILVAISQLIKFLATAVYEKGLTVQPSDSAIPEPFTFDRKTIFVPPDSHVRFTLQGKAALSGFDDDAIYSYCSALLKLAKNFIPNQRQFILEPLELMLKNRKTKSDEILETAQQLGISLREGPTDAEAAKLALAMAAKLPDKIEVLQQKLIHFVED